MRLVLTYASARKNAWLRVYDDFDGVARLAIRGAGWVEWQGAFKPGVQSHIVKILLQPGLERAADAVNQITEAQFRKNFKALKEAVKPFGVKIRGPIARHRADKMFQKPEKAKVVTA